MSGSTFPRCPTFPLLQQGVALGVKGANNGGQSWGMRGEKEGREGGEREAGRSVGLGVRWHSFVAHNPGGGGSSRTRRRSENKSRGVGRWN